MDIKSNLTNMLKNRICEFKFKHRKFNRDCKSIPIESHYTTKKGFYPSIVGKMETNDPSFKWTNVQHDYKLIYDKYSKKYYAHVPKYLIPIQVKNRKPICINDPG